MPARRRNPMDFGVRPFRRAYRKKRKDEGHEGYKVPSANWRETPRKGRETSHAPVPKHQHDWQGGTPRRGKETWMTPNNGRTTPPPARRRFRRPTRNLSSRAGRRRIR